MPNLSDPSDIPYFESGNAKGPLELYAML